MDVLVKPEEESMPQEEGNGGQSGSEDGLVAEYVATVRKNNARGLKGGRYPRTFEGKPLCLGN